MPFRTWDGHCQRCLGETNCFIMSMFSEAQICIPCSESERESPRFKEARAADEAAIKSGNYNFKGIGEGAR